MAYFTVLDHVIVAVADLDAAAETYSRLLGRSPSWRGIHPAWGTGNVLFRLENTYLELLAPRADEGLAVALRQHIDRRGEGPLGFAFGTAEIATCTSSLRDRGLDVGEPLDGAGRDELSGAQRRWRSTFFPPAASRGIQIIAIEHTSPVESLPMAQPVGSAEAAVSGIDHLVVRTEAPDAAIAFYRDGLGLRLALDRTFPDWGVRLLFFRVGGVTVEIAAPADPVSVPAPDDTFWGISWRVPDLTAAHARLSAGGFDISEIRHGRKPDTVVCSVRAPTHGVATLLIGPATPR